MQGEIEDSLSSSYQRSVRKDIAGSPNQISEHEGSFWIFIRHIALVFSRTSWIIEEDIQSIIAAQTWRKSGVPVKFEWATRVYCGWNGLCSAVKCCQPNIWELCQRSPSKVGARSSRIDVVFDDYRELSIKNVERSRRPKGSHILFISIASSSEIKQWAMFLSSNENKNALVGFIVADGEIFRWRWRDFQNIQRQCHRYTWIGEQQRGGRHKDYVTRSACQSRLPKEFGLKPWHRCFHHLLIISTCHRCKL